MSSLLADVSNIQFSGQQKWPTDLKVYQPYEVGQILLTDFANCLSVKAFLKMCGVQYQTELRANAEHMSPTGRLPFIQDGPLTISEFDPVVSYVHSKGETLGDKLSEEEKAEVKAYTSLINNVLVNAELYISWCDKKMYKDVTKGRYGSPYPWPLNEILPFRKWWDVTSYLKVNGWAAKTMDQVCAEIETCCQAISEKLGDQQFFFGNEPTELDALVFGHLYALITTNLPNTKVAETVNQFQSLANFCIRIDQLYFIEKQIKRES